MQQPEALKQLLCELREECLPKTEGQTEVTRASCITLYPTDEDFDDENGLNLNAEDCQLLFFNRETVDRLVDALEIKPSEASLVLENVHIAGALVEYLERIFVAVDEL